MSVFSGLAGRLPRAAAAPHALPSRYRWVNAVLAAAVVGLGVGAYFTVNSSSTPATTASIRTAAVTRGVVLSSVSATGNVQAASQLSVNFRTSGTLSAVLAHVGEHVKAGQILGRIDPTDAKAAVSEAEASLKTAQANLEQTLTGETAAQRAADALSLRQARAQITTAKVVAGERPAAAEAGRRSRARRRRAGAAAAAHRPRQRANRGRAAQVRSGCQWQPGSRAVGGDGRTDRGHRRPDEAARRQRHAGRSADQPGAVEPVPLVGQGGGGDGADEQRQRRRRALHGPGEQRPGESERHRACSCSS